MAKTWKSSRAPAPSVEPSTVTECARRYHACAAALARSLGLPMTADFLQAYHSAISCVYIEAGRAGVRLPPTVQLPPLLALAADTTNGQAPEPEEVPPSNGHGTTVQDSRATDADRPVPENGTVVPSPTTIPPDAGLPCGGQAIAALKPAQLAMLVSKVARLVQDQGGRWVPLRFCCKNDR